MSNDQRGTPFRQNIADLWKAIKTRGRVGHELKNVAVELVREHPAKTVLVILVLVFIIAEWGWSGSFL